MKIREINPEVFQADGPIVSVTREHMHFLKARALKNPRGRARLCAHPGPDDATHEMLIALARRNYIRPHIHPGKVESFHIMEGIMTVVLFEDDGKILEVVPMGDYASGRTFYYRQQKPIYHTNLPESDFAIFLEVTQGPFSREGTVQAPWSPSEEGELKVYLDHLRKRVGAQ